ncbi:MAG TPA: hypothetical protein VG498_17660 [Terriglobales bacterium]|nr:hypothetical protein [Terriglobales bacterium]
MVLFQECHRLNASDFKPLAAADVLAGNHVVFSNHVRPGLGEFSTITLVSARWELALFGSYEPGELIVSSLPAMRTSEIVRPFLIPLVEHFALFQEPSAAAVNTRLLHNANVPEQTAINANSEEKEKVQCNKGGEVHGARHHRHASSRTENSDAQGVTQGVEAQANARQASFGGVSGNLQTFLL